MATQSLPTIATQAPPSVDRGRGRISEKYEVRRDGGAHLC